MATSSTSAYDRHLQRAYSYVHYYGGAPPPAPVFRSEREILEQNHRFVRDDKASDSDEEKVLTKQYYDSLFREYAFVDLSRWREQKVALRWRTKAEVLAGQGQFTCGCLSCSRRHGEGLDDKLEELKTFELNFAYVEDQMRKNALVKVRVCRKCSRKLRKAQKPNDEQTRSHKRAPHKNSNKQSERSRRILKDAI